MPTVAKQHLSACYSQPDLQLSHFGAPSKSLEAVATAVLLEFIFHNAFSSG